MKIKKVDQFLSKLLEVVSKEDYTDKTEKSGLNSKNLFNSNYNKVQVDLLLI